MNTRLQQFLIAENITQAQLADSLNVARAGVSHILAGRNKPSYDFLTSLIQHFPTLNLEWLMFGKGKMYKDTTSSTVSPASPAQAGPQISSSAPLLFDDFDLNEDAEDFAAPQAEIPVQVQAEKINIKANNEINTQSNQLQHIAKQRNVKKILILFDDGTFQEM